jgi:hypothetical protein
MPILILSSHTIQGLPQPSLRFRFPHPNFPYVPRAPPIFRHPSTFRIKHKSAPTIATGKKTINDTISAARTHARTHRFAARNNITKLNVGNVITFHCEILWLSQEVTCDSACCTLQCTCTYVCVCTA